MSGAAPTRPRGARQCSRTRCPGLLVQLEKAPARVAELEGSPELAATPV
jgi:hypothetical protein